MRGKFATLPITVRVALASAVLMVLLGLVASQQVLSALAKLQDNRLQEYARLHVEGLAVALGPFALHRDVWEVYDTLDRAQASATGGRILFTVVSDQDGNVLAATDPFRAPVDSLITDYTKGAFPVGQVTAADGVQVVKVTAPLVAKGRQVGKIVTELDVSDLTAQRRATALALLVGNAVATTLLALAGYFMMVWMLRPVDLLASHMLKTGAAPQPIPEAAIPTSGSVHAKLLRNYNQMAGAVEAQAEAERRLAERERFVSLGRLSSSLAHEINNPLGGLLNAADTIRSYADRPAVVRQAAELMDRGLRHLRDVSCAILDENRIDRTGRPLSKTDFVDLRLLIEPEVTRKAQQLNWDIAVGDNYLRTLPSAPVRQIALNLLLNATAAAPAGGTVSCHLRLNEDAVQLTVADDGLGLTQAARRRLLSADPGEAGDGVGLRLVRDLVAALGGTIRYARSAEQSKVDIILPKQERAVCSAESTSS